MIQILFVILSLISAFFVSWSLAGTITGWVLIFIPALMAIFWFWRLSFSRSLFFAIAIGLLWDTFSIMHFGTYLFTFLALAAASELFKSFFSNTEMALSQAVGMPVLLLAFFVIPQIIQPILKLLL